MGKITSIEVNTFDKADAIVFLLKRAGRLARYDVFFTNTGRTYVIWYRAI